MSRRSWTVRVWSRAMGSVASILLGLSADVAAAPRTQARAFFSGHSLLDNPLPDWVEEIAASLGARLEWEQQIVLGSPIRVRTRGDDASATTWAGYSAGKSRSGRGIHVLEEISSPTRLSAGAQYDTLVITERHDLLDVIRWEGTLQYLRDFHDRLVSSNSQASTLLYQVWPSIDRSRPSAWLTYVRQELVGWECVASKLNHSLATEGRTDRVQVVPGGVALAALVERALGVGIPGISGTPGERLNALFSDDVHLTPLATYYLAAVHYATLFGRSPVGASAPTLLPSAAITTLQELAWEQVSASPSALAPAERLLSECRQRVAAELCPAYSAFWNRSGDCSYWSDPSGPFSGADRASATQGSTAAAQQPPPSGVGPTQAPNPSAAGSSTPIPVPAVGHQVGGLGLLLIGLSVWARQRRSVGVRAGG